MPGPYVLPAPGPYKPVTAVHRWQERYGQIIIREYRDGDITIEFKPEPK